MKDLKELKMSVIEQIIFDPENQPHQFGRLIWNGNEIVFEGCPNFGIAGIAPNMPDRFGQKLVEAYNDSILRAELAPPEDLEGPGECEKWCGENYCDENGCVNRKRHLVNPIPTPEDLEAEAIKVWQEMGFPYSDNNPEDRIIIEYGLRLLTHIRTRDISAEVEKEIERRMPSEDDSYKRMDELLNGVSIFDTPRLPNNDTQIGWEECHKWLISKLKQ